MDPSWKNPGYATALVIDSSKIPNFLTNVRAQQLDILQIFLLEFGEAEGAGEQQVIVRITTPTNDDQNEEGEEEDGAEHDQGQVDHNVHLKEDEEGWS